MGRYHPTIGAALPELRSPKEPLGTRSLATALAIGAPLGLIIWLAVQEMPNLTWLVGQLFMHAGQ